MEVAVDKTLAFDEIFAYINKQNVMEGGLYTDWYCGIAELIDLRLFDEHKLPREEGSWRYIHRKCFNADEAMSIESTLLKAGPDGCSGDVDEDCIYVYAYLKGDETDPGIECCH